MASKDLEAVGSGGKYESNAIQTLPAVHVSLLPRGPRQRSLLLEHPSAWPAMGRGPQAYP